MANVLLIVLASLFGLAGLVGIVLLVIGLVGKKRGLWITGLVLALVMLLLCCCLGLGASLVSIGPGTIRATFVSTFEATVVIPGFTDTQEPTGTPEPSETPAVAATPEESTAPLPSKTPAATAVPQAAGLTPKGPWWLLGTVDDQSIANGLYAVNADGSGLTQVYNQHYEGGMPVMAPSGGRAAFITVADASKMTGLTLQMLTLPDGKVKAITALASKDLSAGDNPGPGDPGFETLRAIDSTGNLAWSPDGKLLAFSAALDTKVSNIYVYDLTNGKTQRVTNGKANAIDPVWSPDGQQIAFTTVTSLGTGAGVSMDGVWVLNLPVGSVKPAYALPRNTGGENILGWAAPGKLVVDTWMMTCGISDLRVVDLNASKATSIWKDCVSGRGPVLSDDGSALLFSVSSDLKDFNKDPKTGLAWASTQTGTVKWIGPDGNYDLQWQPGGTHYFAAAGDDQITTVSTAGEILYQFKCGANPCTPKFAMGGPSYAASPAIRDMGAKGLWVGNIGSEATELFTDHSATYSWVPQTETLLFLSNGSLYRLSQPDLKVEKVASDKVFGMVNEEAWCLP